jgi:hypothetical protein
MTFREIQPEDVEAFFEVRVKTWHNPDGAEELARMAITPNSVLKMMRNSHRGWLTESNNEVI